MVIGCTIWLIILPRICHDAVFKYIGMYNHAIKNCKKYAYLFLLPTGKSKVQKTSNTKDKGLVMPKFAII